MCVTQGLRYHVLSPRQVSAFERKVQDFGARESDVLARETALRDGEATIHTRTVALQEREMYVLHDGGIASLRWQSMARPSDRVV
jgi:aminoglycoside phosphotransferase family enzyme